MTAPAAPISLPRRRRGTLTGALALIAACACAAALVLPHARSGTAQRPGARPGDLNALIAGAPLQRASCANWLRASAAERARAVGTLAAVVGAPTEYKGRRGTALRRAQAYALLDNACSQPVARNFLIYILYARAAGFGGSGL